MTKILCYVLHAVLIDENDDGEIVGTVNTEPAQLFGRAQLEEHLASIDELAAARSTGTAG